MMNTGTKTMRSMVSWLAVVRTAVRYGSTRVDIRKSLLNDDRNLYIEDLSGAKAVRFRTEEICQLPRNVILSGLRRSDRHFDQGQIDVILVLGFWIFGWRLKIRFHQGKTGNFGELEADRRFVGARVSLKEVERDRDFPRLTRFYRPGGAGCPELRSKNLRQSRSGTAQLQSRQQ